MLIAYGFEFGIILFSVSATLSREIPAMHCKCTVTTIRIQLYCPFNDLTHHSHICYIIDLAKNSPFAFYLKSSYW
jgi:hypothetical protein